MSKENKIFFIVVDFIIRTEITAIILYIISTNLLACIAVLGLYFWTAIYPSIYKDITS